MRRIFITDDCEDLLPAWLRFIRGVIDSEDLPLNVSREMLQNNPVLTRIRTGLIKRVISELKKKSKKDAEPYALFWNNFGAVLKEGLYESADYRNDLLELVRFSSIKQDNLISLKDYIDNMAAGQEDIFYISGESMESVVSSPQLEAFRERGINVLLMIDPVDEFWLPMVSEYQGKKFRSATRGDIDLETIGKTPEKNPFHSSENKIVKPYTENIIPKRSDLSHSEKIQMFARYAQAVSSTAVSYTHLRAHETDS